jgi:hypothetical protein
VSSSDNAATSTSATAPIEIVPEPEPEREREPESEPEPQAPPAQTEHMALATAMRLPTPPPPLLHTLHTLKQSNTAPLVRFVCAMLEPDGSALSTVRHCHCSGGGLQSCNAATVYAPIA